ncbi:MAG TPA: nucleotidyltransferase family protein, partial [Solirubrobacteraceae bacterium]|nr:nucleotidyltransferase family protein [Solirubrobacteraceae bacterium]
MRSPSELRTLSAAVARACGADPRTEPVGDVDWDEVVRLADRHHVAGLAHRGLQDTAPETVRAALAERAQAVAFGSLHRAALQRRVTRALEAATVRFGVLKGLPRAVDA